MGWEAPENRRAANLRRVLGRGYQPWSDMARKQLAVLFNLGKSDKEIAKIMGRKVAAVKAMRVHLGMRRQKTEGR